MAQVGENLPSKHEALISTSSMKEERERGGRGGKDKNK
jgi:hypothetical protein